MKDILPPTVFDTIRRHLTSRGNRAHRSWEAASEDEDTLTGDFGRSMARSWSRGVRVDGQVWHWRVSYKKFRGRGEGAFEAHSGADGIFQIEVARNEREEVHHKGVLFQAKARKIGFSSQLIGQVTAMEHIAPNGSVVFEYGPDGYRAIPSNHYFEQLGIDRRLPRDAVKPIGDFLGDQFLPCEAGIRGMYYDANRKQLLVPSTGNIMLSYHLDLGHRIRVDVISTLG